MVDDVKKVPAIDGWETQVRKGLLELAVLATLHRERQYGLQILQSLQSAARLSISESTLYPLLNRLRLDGCVTADWVEADAGHPRKYYELTPFGRQRARLMAVAWQQLNSSLDSLIGPLQGERRR